VGNVINGVGLSLFGPLYLTLSPNHKNYIFVSFFEKNRQKSTSSEPLISLLVFIVQKLWPKHYKLNN